MRRMREPFLRLELSFDGVNTRLLRLWMRARHADSTATRHHSQCSSSEMKTRAGRSLPLVTSRSDHSLELNPTTPPSSRLLTTEQQPAPPSPSPVQADWPAEGERAAYTPRNSISTIIHQESGKEEDHLQLPQQAQPCRQKSTPGCRMSNAGRAFRTASSAWRRGRRSSRSFCCG